VIKGFCGAQTNWYFGVFDGHGAYGHLASDFASKSVSSLIQSTLEYKTPRLPPTGKSSPKDEIPDPDINNCDE
jgi:serine/threonine protein phosphatase PrpC